MYHPHSLQLNPLLILSFKWKWHKLSETGSNVTSFKSSSAMWPAANSNTEPKSPASYSNYSADQLIDATEDWVKQRATITSGVVILDPDCLVRIIINNISDPWPVCAQPSSTGATTPSSSSFNPTSTLPVHPFNMLVVCVLQPVC